jgi:DNA modification methylase
VAQVTAKLFVADIRNGLPEVADNSIDVIITDPPYARKHLDCWALLGQVAQRVLKPHGSLLAMTGNSYFNYVVANLSWYLDWHWQICVLQSHLGGVGYVYGSKIHQYWKSIVWFTKGKYTGKSAGDMIYSDRVPLKKDHIWQQNLKVFLRLVRHYTRKNDRILDPFLGSGTTLLACKQSMREHIMGCDIDPVCIATANRRLNEYQSIERWMK